MKITTHSEQETEAAGAELAKRLQGGSGVALIGDLGAGKTCFVRGLARGLGIPSGEVLSPTFTLINEYHGKDLDLIHVDLYRLNHQEEVERLGLEEYVEPRSVVVVEWADKLLAWDHSLFWRKNMLMVHFEVHDGKREVKII